MEKNLINEEVLLKKAAKGDEIAFRQLFDTYWPQVYGTSLRLTHSSDWAEDFAQDVFIKLWIHREKLADVKKLDAYIYTVSKNVIFDELKKKVFAPANIDFLIDYFAVNTYATPQEKLEYAELEATLRQAIDVLPDKLRQVFLLSRFEGLSHAAIAEKLNISVVSSKTYIVRALHQIRRYLDNHSKEIKWLMILFWMSKNN